MQKQVKQLLLKKNNNINKYIVVSNDYTIGINGEDVFMDFFMYM